MGAHSLWTAACACTVAACAFHPGSTAGQPGDATCDCTGAADTPDTADTTIDTPAGVSCFGTGTFSICLTPGELPATVHDVSGDIDTGGAGCDLVVPQTGGPELCVLDGTKLTVSTSLTAHGARALVLLSTGDLEITGTVDVASHRGGATGPAANTSACAASGNGVTSSSAGSGGAGGSFGSKGGDGGTSNSGNGAGGVAGAVASAPTLMRGGCPGGNGANGAANTAGPHGDGGGAVYLVAGGAIKIAGTINASGAGADLGKPSKGGGGGAGSGGTIIVFAATSLDVGAGAVLVANGGGGGGGSANGATGGAGFDPNAATPLTPAAGGTGGGTNGGPGGAGAASTLAAVDGQGGSSRTDGGGGGGGGVGFIRFLSVTTSNLGTISPSPVP